ncbi:MAG: sulfite exporter TauE/SafE family protein [Chloroflexi bacterium]|nr:sulfite exporter TauE/SafE family protein [Chloroflexota bacterium]
MEETLLFAVVAILIGFSKGGLGGPVPVALTVPILSLIIEPQEAISLILPLLIFADIFALYFYWKQWDKGLMALMLVPGLIGVAVGAFILKDIDAVTLKRMIGGLTLVALSFKIGSERLRRLAYHPQAWHGWFAGWASGFGSTLANVGAPPFTAYLLLQPNMTPRVFVGTTTLFFAVINLTKLPTYITLGILDLSKLAAIAWVFILIPLAIAAARAMIDRINQRAFEWIMMAPLLILSIFLLFSVE